MPGRSFRIVGSWRKHAGRQRARTSFGLPAWRCDAPDDFGPTLRKALDADEPSLIVLPIDYSIDVAISEELGTETVAT